MLPPGSLASGMILSQAQDALYALQVTRLKALPQKEPQKEFQIGKLSKKET